MCVEASTRALALASASSTWLHFLWYTALFVSLFELGPSGYFKEFYLILFLLFFLFKQNFDFRSKWHQRGMNVFTVTEALSMILQFLNLN